MLEGLSSLRVIWFRSGLLFAFWTFFAFGRQVSESFFGYLLDGNVIRERRNGTEIKHVYEVRPRKDKRGADLISDAPPFSRPRIAAAPLQGGQTH